MLIKEHQSRRAEIENREADFDAIAQFGHSLVDRSHFASKEVIMIDFLAKVVVFACLFVFWFVLHDYVSVLGGYRFIQRFCVVYTTMWVSFGQTVSQMLGIPLLFCNVCSVCFKLSVHVFSA